MMIDVYSWLDDDPRIHARPNCRYRDSRTALDIICEMVIEGLIKIEYF